MNPCDLLQALRAAGVTLRIVGNTLRYRAPRGALTPELRAALAEHKPDILHDYHERAGIAETQECYRCYRSVVSTMETYFF